MKCKVLSERVLGCHDVVLLCFMLFIFDNRLYNSTLPTPGPLKLGSMNPQAFKAWGITNSPNVGGGALCLFFHTNGWWFYYLQ